MVEFMVDMAIIQPKPPTTSRARTIGILGTSAAPMVAAPKASAATAGMCVGER